MRDTIKTVTFDASFTLRGLDGVQPAGTYEVLTTEKRVDTMLFDAWRRTNTQLRVPSLARDVGQVQYVTIQPGDLDDALMADRGERLPRRQNFIRD
jgi:hypothetical protein